MDADIKEIDRLAGELDSIVSSFINNVNIIRDQRDEIVKAIDERLQTNKINNILDTIKNIE